MITEDVIPGPVAGSPPVRRWAAEALAVPDHVVMAESDDGLTLLPYGDRALLVEVSGLDAVAAVRAALERDPLPGQVDLVPAARTVLVLLDRAPADTDTARLRRLSLTPPAGGDDVRTVELPVVFDGPDLDDVAELTSRPVPRLVEELTTAELTVAFSGFAPGFGYLTGLPGHLHVPRRTTPRTRVPAGAVGLAGPFAGAYPRASPGGWQLVGRTDAVLFDVDRDPPALLSPGTRVRLREVR
jgi:KipI family sensor histidine kinase inhibitor